MRLRALLRHVATSAAIIGAAVTLAGCTGDASSSASGSAPAASLCAKSVAAVSRPSAAVSTITPADLRKAGWVNGPDLVTGAARTEPVIVAGAIHLNCGTKPKKNSAAFMDAAAQAIYHGGLGPAREKAWLRPWSNPASPGVTPWTGFDGYPGLG